MQEDADMPEEKQRNLYQIENQANKEVAIWLKSYIAEHQLAMDFTAAETVNPEQMGFDMDVPEVKKPDMAKYGAFMGTHLQSIAKISQHVDQILEAALYDVHQKDGSGHHFRAAVLQLGISGVGPKVCSFAWLLLQPMTSQLATIDTHMMDVLGHNFEKDMNNRDYFKFERELAAGRDAAGYGGPDGMPLGMFQWGMWDHKRTGPGSHQDHSAMKVLDPVPHNSIGWEEKAQNFKGADWSQNRAPEWWQQTAPAREAVAQHYEQNIAPNVPQNQYPWNNGSMPEVLAKTSASTLVPWFLHPTTGARINGSPGLTLMQHARSVLGGEPEDIWGQLPDESVGKV